MIRQKRQRGMNVPSITGRSCTGTPQSRQFVEKPLLTVAEAERRTGIAGSEENRGWLAARVSKCNETNQKRTATTDSKIIALDEGKGNVSVGESPGKEIAAGIKKIDPDRFYGMERKFEIILNKYDAN